MTNCLKHLIVMRRRFSDCVLEIRHKTENDLNTLKRSYGLEVSIAGVGRSF